MKHLSLLFCLFLTPSLAAAPQQAEPDALPVPESLEQALEIAPTALLETLGSASEADLQPYLAEWSVLIEQQAVALEEAIAKLEGTPRRRSVSSVAANLDRLIAGAEVLAELFFEVGGDGSALRAQIAEIRRQKLERTDQVFTVPLSSFVAEGLSIEALRAALRPLTGEQVEIQKVAWMEFLQLKCLAVRNAEVAALRSDSAEGVATFSEVAFDLRGERASLIERVDVVLDSLEEKGGDVTLDRAYVTSVFEVPAITGWLAALATVRSWLTDEDGGRALTLSIVQAILIVIAAWFLAGLLSKLAARALRSTKTSALLQEFVALTMKRGLLALGALVALGKLGLDMGPLMAAIGAAGLVIGLALQGTLSNIASGLLIMTNRPFDVGDIVSMAGVDGIVRGMTLITTRIVTFDNQTVFVPNNRVWNDVIRNSTANRTRRVDLVFGIGYGDDLRKAQRVLNEILAEHPQILKNPEPVVRVQELGDSSVNFVVRPWVEVKDYWDVYWDLTERVKERFDSEGISIPFPQRDVHLHPQESGVKQGAEKQ